MSYRVTTYEAHNVKGVKDIRFDLTGRHLFIVGGGNAQGKSSALDALRMALCGKSGCDYPEVPLRNGEKEAWVKVALEGDLAESGLVIEQRWTKSRSGAVSDKFRVTDSTGADVPTPRTLLQKLFSLRAFDPLEFSRLSKADKRNMLLKLIGLDLAEFKKRHDKIYAERTLVGREGKRLVGKLDAMPHHANVPSDEISIVALYNEKAARKAVNDRNQKERERLVKMQQDVATRKSLIEDVSKQISELQKSLEDHWLRLDGEEAVAKAQAETVDVLEDQDLAEVDAQVENAEVVNRKVRENKARDEVAAEVDASREKWEALAQELADIADEQEEALKNASWPVEGLAFDEDGVLYNGLPIEQCSRSEQIMLSARIGMALNPRLRLMVSDNGSDMDTASLDSLDAVLKENDFQLVMELVTRSDEDEERCAVVIEDGEIRQS